MVTNSTILAETMPDLVYCLRLCNECDFAEYCTLANKPEAAACNIARRLFMGTPEQRCMPDIDARREMYYQAGMVPPRQRED